jgi:ABC-type transporter Mla subunit MlaD
VKSASYWKIGAFVVAGVALALVALVYLSSGILGRSTVEYQVYFDESVEGLNVGSLVRFRGVTLGQVSRIRVAPDRRHIQVSCALRTGELRNQGLDVMEDNRRLLAQPPGLRAQLTIIGLTGQEIVSLDYFDPATHPAPELPFTPAPRTIPAAPSVIGSIENSLERASSELPELVGSLIRLTGEASDVLLALRDSDLAGRAGTTLSRADEALASIRRITDRLSAEQTPENVARAVTALDAALSSLNALIEELGGDHGLLGRTRRAADALVGTAQASNPLGRQLQATLRDAQSTLAAIRRLADTVERQPDALIKGRGGNAR